MTWLALIVLVALAAAYDVLTISWHRAREAGNIGRTVMIGCTMEVIGTLPLAVSVATGNYWILATGVVGSAIGTAWGMRRATADR